MNTKKMMKVQAQRKPKTLNIPMMPQMPGNGDNIIESMEHTLISDERPSEMIPLEMDGQIVPNIFEQVEGYTLHKLFINDFGEEGKGLHKILDRLQNGEETDQLEFHIASNGGYVSEGIQFYNVINSMYKERSTAFLSHGYSMGALLFLMCNQRIVYEHSDFMVHSYAGGAYGKREDMINQLEHSDKQLKKFFKKLMTPYFSDKEIDKINKGKDYWMDSKELLKRGIATGIIIDGEYFERDEYFDVFKKDGTKRKKPKSSKKKGTKAEEE